MKKTPSFRPMLFIIAFTAMMQVAWRAGAVEGNTARVGVYQIHPFVMPDANTGFTGYGIELWEHCARKTGHETEYVEFKNIAELMTAVGQGNVDLAITGLSMTRERARRVRFSFPWYDSGYRIMAKTYEPSLWNELRYDKQLRIYLLFILVFLMLAYLMFLVRRKKDPEFPAAWKDGYFLSLLDVVTSVRSGRLEQKYLGWIGHILSLVWLLCGMAAVTYVTSTMTTAMTALSVDRYRINDLSDLAGSDIGVLHGSTPEAYVKAMGGKTVSADSLQDVIPMLASGKVRAIVADAPALEYWLKSNPGAGFELAGPLFHNDKFAFAAGKDKAEFMDAIDRELIRLFDAGELAMLREKYFGGE